MSDFIILVFFVTLLNIYGFDTAMLWTMILAAAFIIGEHALGRRLHPLQWVAYATIFLFGVPSLIWKTPLIFQYKITILYVFFALSLLIYPFFSPKTLIEIFFPDMFLKESYIWINRWLVLIFLNGAIMNDAAIQMFTVEQWGIFKLFLIATITLSMSLVFYYFLMVKVQHDNKNKINTKEETEEDRKL